MVIQLEAELALLGLRPPELGVASQRLLRKLLLLILDEGFQRVHPLCAAESKKSCGKIDRQVQKGGATETVDKRRILIDLNRNHIPTK